MKPVNQTIFGKMGNCFAASVASILECPLDEVEDLFPAEGDYDNPERWKKRMDDGLLKRGLFMVEIPFKAAWQELGREIRIVGALPPGQHVILGSMSHSGLNHATVGITSRCMEDGQIIANVGVVHDPIGEVEEFYDLDCVILLCKTS